MVLILVEISDITQWSSTKRIFGVPNYPPAVSKSPTFLSWICRQQSTCYAKLRYISVIPRGVRILYLIFTYCFSKNVSEILGSRREVAVLVTYCFETDIFLRSKASGAKRKCLELLQKNVQKFITTDLKFVLIFILYPSSSVWRKVLAQTSSKYQFVILTPACLCTMQSVHLFQKNYCYILAFSDWIFLPDIQIIVILEVLTALTLKIAVFWDLTPCNFV
jgi:hypothetical protein